MKLSAIISLRISILESRSRKPSVHLKPKTFKCLNAMAWETDLFAEARVLYLC